MTTLADLKARALQVLSDSQGTRYNSDLMDEAFNQALDKLNTRLPRLIVLDLPITTPGRDQVVVEMARCLFIVSVCLVNPAKLTRELQADSEFTFQLFDCLPSLHFTGAKVPQEGDTLRVHTAYSHRMTVAGAGK